MESVLMLVVAVLIVALLIGRVRHWYVAPDQFRLRVHDQVAQAFTNLREGDIINMSDLADNFAKVDDRKKRRMVLEIIQAEFLQRQWIIGVYIIPGPFRQTHFYRLHNFKPPAHWLDYDSTRRRASTGPSIQ